MIAVEGPGRCMYREEILTSVGSCPRCRRTVLVLSNGRRPAMRGETGNVCGTIQTLPVTATDPLPRDRPLVAAIVPGSVFSRRLGPEHSCNSPDVAPLPEVGYGPRNRSRMAEVYDGGGDA